MDFLKTSLFGALLLTSLGAESSIAVDNRQDRGDVQRISRSDHGNDHGNGNQGNSHINNHSNHGNSQGSGRNNHGNDQGSGHDNHGNGHDNGYENGSNGNGYGHCKKHHQRGGVRDQTKNHGHTNDSPGHAKHRHKNCQGREKKIKISGLNDINLGNWPGPGSSNVVAESNICIGITGSSATGIMYYSVKVDSLNSGSDFKLSSGFDEIPLSVSYSPSLSGAGFEVDKGQTYPGMSFLSRGSNSLNTEYCEDRNAKIKVKVLSSDVESAKTGLYSTTLIIKVIPI